MRKWWGIWNQMTKPRVTSLVLATVFPGLYLDSQTSPSWDFVLFVLLGTYFMGSSSFIFNQYVEREKDSKMYRTKERPIPSGLVSPNQALVLGFGSLAISFLFFFYFVNLLAFLCSFAALVLYVFLYTIWLKPRTEQNIVIGGISGCVGPLIGYAASTNSLPLPAWVLVLIIFLWTPAHFWSLAIFLKEDYEFAGIPMMPVVSGIGKTVKQIFAYSVLYSVACGLFFLVQPDLGPAYLVVVVFLTMILLSFARYLWLNPDPKLAKRFFFFTILHLFLVNLTIVLDTRF